METNEIRNEELTPIEENQTFDGVVEPVDEHDGNSAGSYALLGLAIVGGATLAKAAWKYAVKPVVGWAKTKLAEKKTKKETEESSEAESETESDSTEE